MQWILNYAIYLLTTFSHTSMAKLNNYLESCIIIRDLLLDPCKKMCFSSEKSPHAVPFSYRKIRVVKATGPGTYSMH